VSVGAVVPTLGENERLGMLVEAVGSIQRQRGVDVRLIVVTVTSRVDSVSAALPGVRVLAQPGRGIVDAISRGWTDLPVDTEFVTWLGDDDRLVDGALSTAQLALQARPEAAMVFGRCRYIRFDGSQIREIRPGRIAVPLLRMGTNLIAQPGSLYRLSNVAAAGGLDSGLSLAFDVDLHLRLATRYGAIYVPRLLGEARVHPASLTTSQRGRSIAEVEQVMSRGKQSLALRAHQVCRPAVHLTGRVAYKVSSRVPGRTGSTRTT